MFTLLDIPLVLLLRILLKLRATDFVRIIRSNKWIRQLIEENRHRFNISVSGAVYLRHLPCPLSNEIYHPQVLYERETVEIEKRIRCELAVICEAEGTHQIGYHNLDYFRFEELDLRCFSMSTVSLHKIIIDRAHMLKAHMLKTKWDAYVLGAVALVQPTILYIYFRRDSFDSSPDYNVKLAELLQKKGTSLENLNNEEQWASNLLKCGSMIDELYAEFLNLDGTLVKRILSNLFKMIVDETAGKIQFFNTSVETDVELKMVNGHPGFTSHQRSDLGDIIREREYLQVWTKRLKEGLLYYSENQRPLGPVGVTLFVAKDIRSCEEFNRKFFRGKLNIEKIWTNTFNMAENSS